MSVQIRQEDLYTALRQIGCFRFELGQELGQTGQLVQFPFRTLTRVFHKFISRTVCVVGVASFLPSLLSISLPFYLSVFLTFSFSFFLPVCCASGRGLTFTFARVLVSSTYRWARPATRRRGPHEVCCPCSHAHFGRVTTACVSWSRVRVHHVWDISVVGGAGLFLAFWKVTEKVSGRASCLHETTFLTKNT